MTVRRAFTACALAAASGAAAAADGGFSYLMGLGRQDFSYRETSSTLPVRSDVRSGGPLIVTGGLYELPGGHLLSLDAQATFYPGRATETWTATGPVFNNVSLTSPVLQTNGFSLRQDNTQLAGHWHLQDHWFAIGSVAMRSQSFKRHSFVVGVDHAVSVPAGSTVEESTSEVLGGIGMAYESTRVRDRELHYGLRVQLAKPLWRRLENTSQPQVRFDGTGGWDFALEGRCSWALLPNVHLGGWAQWSQARRGRQVQAGVEVPDSRLTGTAVGLELLWKL